MTVNGIWWVLVIYDLIVQQKRYLNCMLAVDKDDQEESKEF